MVEQPFSHVDGDGKLSMVDVTPKRATVRRAEASCVVRTVIDAAAFASAPSALDPVHAARLAGIQAAKLTANLIPLCHPLNLNDIRVDIIAHEHVFEVTSLVVTVHRTGVEMEALTACAVAALGLLSSLQELDPSASIDGLVLERKSGGKSGDWGRRVATKK